MGCYLFAFLIACFVTSTVLMPAKQNFLAQAETARQGEGDKEPAVESPESEAEISEAFKKPPYINSDNENTARTKTPEELNFGKENVAADLNATGSLISEIKQNKTAGLVSQKSFEFLLNYDLSGFKGILTFDDGPHPQTTPKILKILDKSGVRNVVFFFLGYRIIEYPHLVRMVDEAGYEIGYHSMYHQNLVLLTSRQIQRDVEMFKKALYNALGREYPLRIGRPPYGGMTTNSVKIFRDLENKGSLSTKKLDQEVVKKLVHPLIVHQFRKNNLELMLWNVDFDDWEKPIDIVHLKNNYAPEINQVFGFHEMPVDIRSMELYDNEIVKHLPMFLITVSELHEKYLLEKNNAATTNAPGN